MKSKYLYYITLRSLIVLILCLLGSAGTVTAKKFTVVIDAGHGGKDIGAMDNGATEKNINLDVALKVGEYIKKNSKDIKVVYTRDKDEYLTLQQRADIANKAKADLFISVHTNSLDKNNPKRTSVAGASTYTLGLHKDDDNMNVARRENSVMTLENNYETTYSGFDPKSDESYIIFEMAQKGNMANAVKFADMVQKQMRTTADRQDRGVHQAGFWVLWATSMPAVLVELDFICNPESAKFLTSSAGQTKLGKAIGSAAIAYFKALEEHDKKRLHTEQKAPSEIDMDIANGDGAVMASVIDEEVKISAPQDVISERTRKPATRRRRSDASREKSERQQYAEAIIKDDNVYVDNNVSAVVAQDYDYAAVGDQAKDVQNVSKNSNSKTKKSASDKKVTKDSGNKAPKSTKQQSTKQQPKVKTSTKPSGQQLASNKSKVNDDISLTKFKDNGKEQAKNNKPTPKAQDATTLNNDVVAKSNRQSPVKLNKITTVYKIQILACDEKLNRNSPEFHGLNDITCRKEGNTYYYLYGSSYSRDEMNRRLQDIKKIIPDAKIVEVRQTENARR
ncbi:MAG: N-acetylmuramoyl-L-alanine amidase [Muribaculaceae bacterium]|nr:N-acetylmuramoyl-L-alanine amidase [Muribaculaceae bacterium]